MTVNWNVSATGAFAGTKQTTFLFVRDTSGLSDGYTAKGTWTINGNARPSTVSVSPASVTTTAGVEQKVGLLLVQSLHAGDTVVVTWDGGSTTLTAS